MPVPARRGHAATLTLSVLGLFATSALLIAGASVLTDIDSYATITIPTGSLARLASLDIAIDSSPAYVDPTMQAAGNGRYTPVAPQTRVGRRIVVSRSPFTLAERQAMAARDAMIREDEIRTSAAAAAAVLDEPARMQQLHDSLRARFRLAMNPGLAPAVATQTIASAVAAQPARLVPANKLFSIAVVIPADMPVKPFIKSVPKASAILEPTTQLTIQKPSKTQLHPTVALPSQAAVATSGGGAMRAEDFERLGAQSAHQVMAAPARMDTQAAAGDTTQTDTLATAAASAVEPETANLPLVHAPFASTVTQIAPMTTQPAQIVATTQRMAPVCEYAPFVEAFDDCIAVADGVMDSLSKEAANPSVGWKRSSASQHWSTLSWNTSRVPLLSNNAGEQLAKISAFSLQREMGFIFGKVPAGWTVEISDRAERAIYLDSAKQMLPAQASDTERQFVFFNASPGSHLIYLVRAGSRKTGAFAVPVLRGVGTYLDLTGARRVDVTGSVYSANARGEHGLSGVTVRAVGDRAPITSTDSLGVFNLPGVLALPGFPMQIETETTRGFTHRYRVFPEAASDLHLFRFAGQLIDSWKSQLEGGLSPGSGLVIGVIPKAAQLKGVRQAPKIKPLLGAATLNAETYALSGDWQLQAERPADMSEIPFVTVQLSEGPTLIQAQDAAGKTSWSELVHVSPDVIDIVGIN